MRENYSGSIADLVQSYWQGKTTYSNDPSSLLDKSTPYGPPQTGYGSMACPTCGRAYAPKDNHYTQEESS